MFRTLLMSLIVCTLLGLLGCGTKEEFTVVDGEKLQECKPCRQSLRYRVEVPSGLPISLEDFARTVREAESSWEGILGRDLFIYDPKAKFVVRFIKDEKLPVVLDIWDMSEQIREMKRILQESKERYEDKKDRIAELSQRIDEGENELIPEHNALVREIHTLAEELNELGPRLAAQVKARDEISKRHFDQRAGWYTEVGNDAKTIDIHYMYSVQGLLEILQHEFGHGLGLPHLTDDGAIMQAIQTRRLGESINVSSSDVAALKAVDSLGQGE